MRVTPKRIGFFVYPGFAALDLAGVHETFISAESAPGNMSYEPVIFSTSIGPVKSESGITIHSTLSCESVSNLDTVIIPGGKGLRDPVTQQIVAGWLRHNAPNIRRVASVCTGIYGLAASGLLDGRKVTTHWAFIDDVARRFPKVQLVEDEIYVQDGKFYTSAGVTTGIDLVLAMIEEDFGSAVCHAVARELVVFMRRPGKQKQLSDLLRFQAKTGSPCDVAVDWILANLKADLSLESIAAQSNLSSRQLSRLFVENYGTSPIKFVEKVRLDEARTLLMEDGSNMAGIAAAVGFANVDSFRRAFTRQFGVSPGQYHTAIHAN
ncbi:MAG: GlxA family transcriptional regulator [Armatimonadota bacterium]